MSRNARQVFRLLLRSRSGPSTQLLLQSQSRAAGAAAASHDRTRVSARAGLSTVSMTTENHTAKWMIHYDEKSPQELIAEVPPIEVQGRVVACEGGRDPALGHPIEYICVDLPEPISCKYCGLRYVQAHDHH